MDRAARYPVPLAEFVRREIGTSGWVLILAAVVFGTLVPAIWRIGLAAVGVTMTAALLGPSPLAQILVLTAGLSLAPLTDFQRALLPALGGLNLDGLRLIATFLGFAWILSRESTLIAHLRSVAPYLAFLIWGAASLFWAPDRIEGLRLFLKLTFPMLAYFLADYAVREGGAKAIQNRVMQGALLAIAVNLILSLLQDQWTATEADLRYRGILGHNLIGHFSSITALACFAWWADTRRPLMGYTAIALTIQMIATGSRTAFVAFGAGVLVFQAMRRRWLQVGLLIAVAVVIWISVPTLGARTELGSPASPQLADASSAEGVNLSGRLLIWHEVVQGMVMPGRAFGSGLGASTLFLANRFPTIRLVHNEFLRTLAELGPFGLLLFLASYFWPLLLVGKRAVRAAAGRRTAFALASAGITTFLVASLGENTFEYFATYSIFPWVYLALAMPAGET